jgi:hypothetical protein
VLYALCLHAWLAVRFKHDGEGLPSHLPAALMLALLYIALNLANKNITEGINLETLIGLSFIAQFYLFGLRNKLIGLILLIGIICNAASLVTIYLTGYTPEKIMMISVMEYAMVFSAMVNVIKRNVKIT